MENSHQYFKRDLSWLSFNYRILLKAGGDTLPIYERIKSLFTYSSNLEEFCEIRITEHRGVIVEKNYSEESATEAEGTLAAIAREVNRQQRDCCRIFSEKILPGLNRRSVYLYQNEKPEPFHKEFARNFFNEEIFPFLSPVMIRAGDIRTFIRDRRLYPVIHMIKRSRRMNEPGFVPGYHYASMKIPYTKVPRFIKLPQHDGKYYIMFTDDIIRTNLQNAFPGCIIDGCYSIKISRDIDIYLDDKSRANIVESVRRKVKKRKIGALSRLMYDRAMPDDFLAFVCDAFGITSEDLVLGGQYNSLQDLMKLPNPAGKHLEQQPPAPVHVSLLDEMGSVFKAARKRDVLLHFPYESFDYLIRFLVETAFNPRVDEIKITQYRVAENSAVINTLVSATQSGKKVAVFMELKARFDGESSVSTTERMEQAGIRIIYNIPGLKVYTEVAVVPRKDTSEGLKRRDFAYLGTDNFNEKTAKIYSDMTLLTSNTEIITDINKISVVLEGRMKKPTFHHLLVTHFGMVSELTGRIRREVEHVREGRKGRIALKMNRLHDQHVIEGLYHASGVGVEIDLIVRGVCRLIPSQLYSANIQVTRIMDMFLGHSWVRYFLNGGQEDLFLTSADWMRRNLSRRIETAFPTLDPDLKREIINILDIQLGDNVKACYLDDELRNSFKCDDNPVKVRSQSTTYDYLRNKSIRQPGWGSFRDLLIGGLIA